MIECMMPSCNETVEESQARADDWRTYHVMTSEGEMVPFGMHCPKHLAKAGYR